MCDMCNPNENVSDAVRNEIENVSDEAMAEIVRIVGEELQGQQDVMLASVMRKFDVEEVVLDRDSSGELKFKFQTGQLKLEGNPSADNETFTFRLVEQEGAGDLNELFKALFG